ncbi:hypothetical protein C2857_002348 [Epichloe festucae Fl1]|uniref:Uncharacterized protein n=1 Tax=Epichloe festucae (strain Fl1) TaxID=877507 RepID=A0A7S9KKI4_EPIFF|nr:hypothetical protein C2857_002348 [Epichloe festucae Fl1]
MHDVKPMRWCAESQAALAASLGSKAESLCTEYLTGRITSRFAGTEPTDRLLSGQDQLSCLMTLDKHENLVHTPRTSLSNKRTQADIHDTRC